MVKACCVFERGLTQAIVLRAYARQQTICLITRTPEDFLVLIYCVSVNIFLRPLVYTEAVPAPSSLALVTCITLKLRQPTI